MKVKEEDLNKWGLTRLDVVVGVFGAIVGILFGLKYTAITFHTLIGVSAVFSGLFIGIECFFEQYKRKENPHVLKTVKSRLVKSQDKLKMTTTGDRKSTRLNSSHSQQSRMPSSA